MGDDGGRRRILSIRQWRILLTHTAVIQTPSLELVEEVEGETYGDYLYVKDDDGELLYGFLQTLSSR